MRKAERRMSRMSPEEKHELWVSYMRIACAIVKPIYCMHIRVREKLEDLGLR